MQLYGITIYMEVHYYGKYYNGFPFEIKRAASYNPYAAMTEDELLAKLERSREQARQGNVRDADDVITDMRERNQ